jgi:PPK2 family polyphosphate:nucleotide phosphotransferase
MAKTSLMQLFRVKPGSKVRLKDHDPAWNGKYESKEQVEELTAGNLERLSRVQDLLFASSERAVLVVLQAMDTAGKDGLIKHVMSGLNPAGCEVFASKQPTEEELSHDFLWRYNQRMPARGRIGIFNRSYYEEVLVVRVHPEWLDRQKIERRGKLDQIWKERYRDINELERHLTENGTVILKFFLNLSKEEQRKRLLARLDEPDKHWKFSETDLAERAYWAQYQEAYEDVLRATSTKEAPWYMIPADHKWVSRWVVSEILAEAMEKLDLKPPRATKEKMAALKNARRSLEKE